VNKLGELREDSKDISGNMDEFQEIARNAEHDISKQDHIKKGEGIEEWKASYISNQSLSEMAKTH
jgi:hypothetical protein